MALSGKNANPAVPSLSNRGLLSRAARGGTIVLVATFAVAGAPFTQPVVTTLIVNATVIDGTGGPGRRTDVRIAGDKIAALDVARRSDDELIIDGAGLVLAPGFIDTHSHADEHLFDRPDALAAVSQGITTLVVGQDGGSPSPLREFFERLERAPSAINLASYVGHAVLRGQVLGNDFKRAATPDEVRRMEQILNDEMDAGALGLSTGLEYDPGIYSKRDEVLSLAAGAARRGGRYISHVRSEDRYFWDAIDEIIAIGRQTGMPVQISHLKLALRSSWGQADKLRGRLDEARQSGVNITADIYPYVYWQSTATSMFPARDFENRETAAFVLEEIATPEGLLIGRFDPDPSFVGKTVADLARARGTDPVTTLIAFIREAEALRKRTGTSAESVIGTSMTEDDVSRLMTWPHANICTDGELDGRHPRGFGAYPRVLGRYVREQKVMTLEEAIRKMTSLPAANMGFEDRGQIKAGAFADLVLLDPATVIDRATPAEPQAVSVGIKKVLVNGVVVYDDQRTTGNRPGRVLRRKTTQRNH